MQTKSHTSYSTYLRAFLIRLTFNRALYYNIINVKIRRNSMYCRKCGKQIDYDSEFCLDCRAEEQAYIQIIESHTHTNSEAQQAAPAQKGARMFGFKRALTSTIMGFASIAAFYVSFIFLLLFLSDTTESASTVLFIIVFFIVLVSKFSIFYSKTFLISQKKIK